MQEKRSRIILLTILITILVLIALGAGFFAILYFGMPKQLAEYSYSLGNEKFAAHLYYKEYEKSGDIDYCYKALNLKIKQSDYAGIIEIYEAYLQDDDYESHSQMMDTYKEYVACTILERSVILNDVDYLEGKYIASLIKVGKSDLAFARAIENLRNYANYDLKNQGAYSLNYFIQDAEKFNQNYENFSKNLIDTMQDYFNASLELFNNNKNTEDSIDQAYLIALGNRLILVGQNINTIYTAGNVNADLIQSNLDNMQNVNDTIKGIIQK